MQKINIWITKTEFVDQATGEIISRKEVDNNYIRIKTNKVIDIKTELNNKTKNNETIGTIKYTIECSRAGKQLKLW